LTALSAASLPHGRSLNRHLPRYIKYPSYYSLFHLLLTSIYSLYSLSLLFFLHQLSLLLLAGYKALALLHLPTFLHPLSPSTFLSAFSSLLPPSNPRMKANILLTGLLSVRFTSAQKVEPVGSQLASCLERDQIPAIWPSSPEYEALAEPFNLRLAYKPAVIVVPKTNQHVQKAVVCAGMCGYTVSLPLSVF
jgi:hypothetical protein